ncbi:glycosyltransferase family 4 protein [Thiocapsa sp.]|uniref:glycosyltransferase family 4 protein n=1 Tax=Thiocapsa sp. TaxID=2024551 RepID=UPI0035945A3A
MSPALKHVLILVENLPSPFDRRVWQEATTLAGNGYLVSIVCPKGKGYDESFEDIDGIHIYRYKLPLEAEGLHSYLIEYSFALWHTLRLALRARRERGVDVIHACNPPDLLFLIGGLFKLLFGTKFIFDHHDINPELYEAKFGKRDIFWKALIWLERMTFRTADVSIATNESYRSIAIERGRMDPAKVFVVRSGPQLDRLKIVPPVPEWKRGRNFLVGYVGVMGKQEGIDLLLQAARYIIKDLGRNDVQFCLVGGGTSLVDMEALAHDLGLSEFVTFTGRIPDQELLEILNTADVCVNPDVANSMNDKSTMNKIMEYMALGKPIVQFELAEGRFSAQDSSLYAQKNDPKDMANKILELLDSPETRRRMGDFGRERIENELEWRYEAPKLLAAYRAIQDDPQTITRKAGSHE